MLSSQTSRYIRKCIRISNMFGFCRPWLSWWPLKVLGTLMEHFKLKLMIWLPVISYPGHFVLTLVISYLLFRLFVPSNNHFVPRSFRTHFGHFVPKSTGYEMTIWWSIRTQVIPYPFWSFRTHFGHFVPSKDGWMGGLMNGWTDMFWLKWQINVLLLIVTWCNSLWNLLTIA